MSCRQTNELALLFEKAKKAKLNTGLMMENGLSTDEIKNIIKLHEEIKNIFNKEQEIIDSGEIVYEKDQLKEMDKRIKEIEFELQKLWHFNQDEEYHSWWFRQPACSCPTLDNFERVGVTGFVINRDCILHGKEDTKCLNQCY